MALVGDACSCPSLLAGQGSALAMLGAYILAGELKRAAGDHQVAFSEYERTLRRFIEKKQRAAESSLDLLHPERNSESTPAIT